ncbi:Hypothetical protein I596_2478 [Dokdonella koreensis DS-123]|uniref:Uncharacterized protein n=1 Tax=Dokdonella koreensis DS-123 TaxID=1300342 RepID=A0A160DX18_9GAMM|nr:Hypothetical protein I596_2478 [Dokdonella koreensis DS-123]
MPAAPGFNPRAPAGRDGRANVATATAIDVSIHAPLRGATTANRLQLGS